MLFEDEVGFCPWHKSDSSFHQVEVIQYASPHHYRPSLGNRSAFDEPPKDLARTSVLIYECMHCHKSVILLEHTVVIPREGSPGIEDGKQWRTMVAPQESPRELHGSAPHELRSLFAEASTCEKAAAYRAAGVMYRATVEALVKDQSATGRNLYDKIESLNSRLTDDLVQDLHEARMLGNDSIHAGITYSREEVEDVAGLIEEAVLVLYVQPEQKRAMREARRARRDSVGNHEEAGISGHLSCGLCESSDGWRSCLLRKGHRARGVRPRSPITRVRRDVPASHPPAR